MTTTILLNQALFRLFAWLFLYPDEERLDTLCRGAKELLENAASWEIEPYAASLRRLLEHLVALDEPGTAELVRVYSKLFAVKPLAPPYESLYTAPNAEARGWVTAQLERIYGRFGLAISELNELPDHLAVELEFMSFLCAREGDASMAGDPATRERARETKLRFLNQHLAVWVPALACRVREVDQARFYPLALEALVDFLHTLAAIQQTDRNER